MSAQHENRAPRIVVGVDGSPSSATALRWAVQQAGLTGASVDAVLGWQVPSPYENARVPVRFPDGINFEEIAEKTLADAIGKVVDPVGDVTVQPLAMRGHAAQVLLDAAQGADLLVVGSRGRGGFASALLGSVSQHCVHHARCPVAVIRDQQPD